MAAPPPASREELTRAALAFLRKVRIRFWSKPCVFEGLETILTEYGKYTIAPTSLVVDGAAALLCDHPDLIAEFNAFVRPEYKIELPADCHPAAAKPQGKRDERQLEAQRFLERVKAEDEKLYDRVVVNLFGVDGKRWMDAHQVYAQLEEVFGPGRRDLLRCFAEFLPQGPPPEVADDEEEPCADPGPSSKRKRAAATYAFAADAVKPIRTIKPRAADLLQISDDGEDVKPGRLKKPRNASLQIGQPAVDDEDDDGEAEGDPCWLVTNQDPHVAAVTFRKILEFHARYSNLVATIKRAEELERTRRPQGGALEDLFPNRECDEILDELYGDGWRTMQAAVEGGERVDVTFAAILLRLRAEEDLAVELARNRRDRTRYGARQGKRSPAGDRRDPYARRPCKKA
uniref:Histone deacetylase interacting domain-containing protein n=1 Tax=Oryza punctata TaxID=4537 RepID=A0A0E0K2S1_ORYPU